MDVRIEPLPDDAVAAARALLVANELPVDDLHDPAIRLFAALHDRELVGVIGLQRCADTMLLRSLAVASERRATGLGQRLCDHVLSIARADRVTTVYLLTTSARDYFARRGFALVDRADVPRSIRETAQFASLCPSSAFVMQRMISTE